MYTYVLNKGNSYHVNVKDGGYEVVYSNGGKLLRQTIEDELSPSENLGICDERIKLFDGKFLSRNRGTLVIENE